MNCNPSYLKLLGTGKVPEVLELGVSVSIYSGRGLYQVAGMSKCEYSSKRLCEYMNLQPEWYMK